VARYETKTPRGVNSERLPDVRCDPFLRELVARAAGLERTSEAEWIRGALGRCGRRALRKHGLSVSQMVHTRKSP
jgi:hypothetical protein